MNQSRPVKHKIPNSINSELYSGHRMLCNLWHLLTFRLGQHLSKSLTFVLPRLCIICILNLCNWLYHTQKRVFVKDADHVFNNSSCFWLLLGHHRYNQSSLLTTISRAPPAVTPGQLSSDFISACTPRFTFPDTSVLLYTSLCCPPMCCFQHPVVFWLLYRPSTIARCGPVVTWITWNTSDSWTLHR